MRPSNIALCGFEGGERCHLVRAWVHLYVWTAALAVVTNCSNNYGPYQFPEKLITVR